MSRSKTLTRSIGSFGEHYPNGSFHTLPAIGSSIGSFGCTANRHSEWKFWLLSSLQLDDWKFSRPNRNASGEWKFYHFDHCFDWKFLDYLRGFEPIGSFRESD